jgi:DNA-binding transcriptional MerR regulator
MQTPALTAEELSDALDVGKTTVRTWLDRLAVEGERGSGGRLYYDRDVLSLLETVKGLRGKGRGLDTITKIVGTPSDSAPTTNGAPAVHEPEANGSHAAPAPVDLMPVVMELNQTVQEVNRLALLLTNAGQENERLRGDVLMAERRLIEAEGQGTIQTAEAARLRDEVADLRRQLDAERGRPWWRRLIGG